MDLRRTVKTTARYPPNSFQVLQDGKGLFKPICLLKRTANA